jgi:hypothetical protein
MTGYESKKAAAIAKLEGPLHVVCQCDKCKKKAAQDKLHEQYDDMYVVYLNGVYDGKKQRPWVGLTEEEIDQGLLRSNHAMQTAGAWRDGVEWATKQLKEKNT